MEISIKNKHVAGAIDLLFNLSLKGKQSRHRSKLVTVLNDRLKELGEDELTVIKEHSHLDKDGEPLKIEGGTKWDIKDLDAYSRDLNDLSDEEFIISGGDKTGYLKTVGNVLLESDREFSGKDAQIYFIVCEAFEEAFEQSKQKKEEE